MQEHHVNVAKRIELTPPISPKGNQRQGHLRVAIGASCSGRRGIEDVSQQNINQFSAPCTDFASTDAGLMPQTQAVLFDLEKFLVEREYLCWTPRTRRGKARLSVRQNFLQLSRCFHHALLLRNNLSRKSKSQNLRTVAL